MPHPSVSEIAELCKIIDIKEIRKFSHGITSRDFSLFYVSQTFKLNIRR